MEFDPVANEVVYEANNKGRELIMFKLILKKHMMKGNPLSVARFDEGESFVLPFRIVAK
jgi:hypothetical protein